jgi:hypothetical protein
VHVPDTQWLPSLQLDPPQHAMPTVPHAVHVPETQSNPALQLPPQHGMPEPPHVGGGAHIPDWHVSPELQPLLGQQISPLPPHSIVHTPAVVQISPALQCVPQQG